MSTSIGRVVALHLCPERHQPLLQRGEVRALPGLGLEGDCHTRKQDGHARQVLLVDTQTLEALGLRPGDLREQVTVDLPGLQQLPQGTLLQVGEARLELAGPCLPCTHIGEHLGREDREAFRDSLLGRRGVLARVVAVEGEGRIRLGDPVALLEGEVTPLAGRGAP